MDRSGRTMRSAGVWLGLCALFFSGCKNTAKSEASEKGGTALMAGTTTASPQVPDDAMPPEKTGGFNGAQAYTHVAKLVSFGPRPAGSQQILLTQDYISSQLSSFGCTVDTDSFS